VRAAAPAKRELALSLRPAARTLPGRLPGVRGEPRKKFRQTAPRESQVLVIDQPHGGKYHGGKVPGRSGEIITQHHRTNAPGGQVIDQQLRLDAVGGLVELQHSEKALAKKGMDGAGDGNRTHVISLGS
jgi:hypothetical protein